jgi:hypothetical protein
MSFHPAGGVGIDSDVPAPPPGPGAAPPFAAPPADRNKRGLWMGLVVGGVLLVVCCVGGVFGIGVLLVSSTEQARREATATVERYLNAVIAQEWEQAHQELCSRLAARVSPSELAAEERRQPFTQYILDEPTLSESVDVLAHLNTRSGEVVRLFQLDTDGSRLAICRIVSQ